ncbi:MAG: hypothetical protein OXP69_01540 [Spirochaetaceae bacterium]|nr:hypothetical protein [Spirochaetaceae bacterium]
MLRPKLMRPEPTASVAAWIAQWDTDELFLTAISEAELRYGVAIVPAGRRKDELEAALTRWLDVGFSDRILPFDSAAARHHAQIAFRHRRAGPTDPRSRLSDRRHISLPRLRVGDSQRPGLRGHRRRSCRSLDGIGTQTTAVPVRYRSLGGPAAQEGTHRAGLPSVRRTKFLELVAERKRLAARSSESSPRLGPRGLREVSVVQPVRVVRVAAVRVNINVRIGRPLGAAQRYQEATAISGAQGLGNGRGPGLAGTRDYLDARAGLKGLVCYRSPCLHPFLTMATVDRSRAGEGQATGAAGLEEWLLEERRVGQHHRQ